MVTYIIIEREAYPTAHFRQPNPWLQLTQKKVVNRETSTLSAYLSMELLGESFNFSLLMFLIWMKDFSIRFVSLLTLGVF